MNSLLKQINPNEYLFKGSAGDYYLIGKITNDPSQLIFTIKGYLNGGTMVVKKIDLYDFDSRLGFIHECTRQEIPLKLVESDLQNLLVQIDQIKSSYIRNEGLSNGIPHSSVSLNKKRKKELLNILQDHQLLQIITESMKGIPLAGNEFQKLIGYLTAISCFTDFPLGLYVHSDSADLLKSYNECMISVLPPECTFTELSAINQKNGVGNYCLITNMSMLSSRDKNMIYRHLNKITAQNELLTSKNPFAANSSFIAFTLNSNTTYITPGLFSMHLYLEPSSEWIGKLTSFWNNKSLAEKCFIKQRLLVDLCRQLHVRSTVNYEFNLPESISKNPIHEAVFQRLIHVITFIHQFQRKLSNRGEIIATEMDAEWAVDILNVLLASGLYNNSTPGFAFFWKSLFTYLINRPIGWSDNFTQTEITAKLPYSKSQINKYLSDLRDNGVVKIVSGSKNKGYLYKLIKSYSVFSHHC